MPDKTTGIESEANRKVVSGSDAAPDGEISQNPNFFGFADELCRLIEDIDIPEPGHIVEHERLREYSRIYDEVSRFDSALKHFDVARGEATWLQGKILNLFKPINSGEKGIIKRGEWKAFIKRFNISPDTSENLRHIAVEFTRAEARQLGYTQMVGIYKADRRLEKEAGAQNDEDQVGNVDGNDDKPNTGEDQGDVPRTLRISDVPKKLERIEQSLDFLADQLPDAVDLCSNPDQDMQRLEGFLTTIDGLLVRIEKLKEAISTANGKVQAFIDERDDLCHDSIQQKEAA